MQHVLVVDATEEPLMPCHPARARHLLKSGRAAVYRRYPFTLILKDREGGETQNIAFKVDPGSKTTGMALVVEGKRGKKAVWAAELAHRGHVIKQKLEQRRMLRRSRRSRKTHYRQPRFNNRTRRKGWLPPSLQSRVDNLQTWLSRLYRLAPLTSISMELVRFDTQQLDNPEIQGVEYQQGELLGYEVREYLLEKWGRKCAYCGQVNVPLEVEHIVPKSRGGSNRVSNLTLACTDCNLNKGTQTAAEFGFPDIQRKAKQPLRHAAAINATRWAIYDRFKRSTLPVEAGTGGRTKFNRTRLGYPKSHWRDAACVGMSGMCVYINPQTQPLLIKATGRGSRQMCGTDKFGFPIRHRTRRKDFFDFQTGDIVKAVVPHGKKRGIHTGYVLCRQSGSFDIRTTEGRVQGIHHRHCTALHKSDGYRYQQGKAHSSTAVQTA